MAETAQAPPKWYTLTPEAVAQQLKVDPAKGLSTAEAQQRLQQYGPNQLAAKKKEPGWQTFLRQYKDFMQIILLGAAVINSIVVRDMAHDRAAGPPHRLQCGAWACARNRRPRRAWPRSRR